MAAATDEALRAPNLSPFFVSQVRFAYHITHVCHLLCSSLSPTAVTTTRLRRGRAGIVNAVGTHHSTKSSSIAQRMRIVAFHLSRRGS
jgi:hypothetical protein